MFNRLRIARPRLSAFNLKHKVAHKLRINMGYPEAFWKGEKLWMGFRCGCGELESMFEWMDEEEYHLGI